MGGVRDVRRDGNKLKRKKMYLTSSCLFTFLVIPGIVLYFRRDFFPTVFLNTLASTLAFTHHTYFLIPTHLEGGLKNIWKMCHKWQVLSDLSLFFLSRVYWFFY